MTISVIYFCIGKGVTIMQFEQRKDEEIFIRMSTETKNLIDKLAKKGNSDRSKVARTLIEEQLKQLQLKGEI